MPQMSIGGLVLGTNQVIKAVQYGSINFTDDAFLTLTDTINTVDLDNTYIIFLGATTNVAAENLGVSLFRVELTNATTVTAYRYEGDAFTDDLTVQYCVVEFMPGVLKSVQAGTIFMNGAQHASNTATINSVNTTKSVVYHLGEIAAGAATGTEPQAYTNLTLTNATTITAFRGSAGGSSTDDTTVGYIVTEYY